MSDASAAVRHLGRREQNKIVNRAAILKAGLVVFSTVGYDAATISDVVKASGLSVGTFYNYYGDKQSVFSELVSDFLAQVRQALHDARNGANSLEQFVQGAFCAYGRLISNNPQLQRFITKNTNAFRQIAFCDNEISGIVKDLEQDMSQAIQKGLLPAFPVRLMTSAMIGAGAEVFAFDRGNSDVSLEEKAEFLGALFLGGIQRLALKTKLSCQQFG